MVNGQGLQSDQRFKFMSDTNTIVIGGNLTRDAELKRTKSDKPVLNFSIANNTGFGDYEATTFFDCCMFGDRVEKLAQHLTKGKSVIVSGEHVQSAWIDKDTGKERRRFELKIRDLNFQKQSRQDQGQPPQQSNVPAPSQERGPEEKDAIPF